MTVFTPSELAFHARWQFLMLPAPRPAHDPSPALGDPARQPVALLPSSGAAGGRAYAKEARS